MISHTSGRALLLSRPRRSRLSPILPLQNSRRLCACCCCAKNNHLKKGGGFTSSRASHLRFQSGAASPCLNRYKIVSQKRPYLNLSLSLSQHTYLMGVRFPLLEAWFSTAAAVQISFVLWARWALSCPPRPEVHLSLQLPWSDRCPPTRVPPR